MKVAAVCGQINSGKGVVSDILVQEHGFVSMAFADPLKYILQQMFGIPDDVLWGPSPKRSGRVRDMLQELGTDFAHKYDKLTWVNLTLKRMQHWNSYGEDLYHLLPTVDPKDSSNIVISDVRFPHEAESLCSQWHTKIFKVVRPDNFDVLEIPQHNRQHASEALVNEIPEKFITATITNDKDLDTFHDTVRSALCSNL
jgi:hypothetical protein